jgi:hypothetical protein
VRKARAGKKRWDLPFRRQRPRTELIRTSPGGRWHVVTDASPPRVTGRDLEARGLTKRLFPPDFPIPEIDDRSDRCSVSSLTGGLQTPQEPLHRRPPPKNLPPSPIAKAGPSSEPHSNPPQPAQSQRPPQLPLLPSILDVLNTPPQQTGSESLPSPLDGSPLPSMIYLPRSIPPTTTRVHPRCRCKHCGHSCSESPVPQSHSVASTVPEEPSPFGGSPLCHACPHTCPCQAPKSRPPNKGWKSPMPCEYPPSAPTESQLKIAQSSHPKEDPEAIPQETSKAVDHQTSMVTHRLGDSIESVSSAFAQYAHTYFDSKKTSRPTSEPPKVTPKESWTDAVKHEPKHVAKAYPPEVPRTTSTAPKASMALWQILLITMGFIIFVFAFAILVAHCLVWSLVYKTEARLGEVRAGLLRGGEMKLCLCGRGG